MSSLDRAFIDDLLSRIDIVEVIGKNVELKKLGSNYKGLCPFHSENTPSFNVSQQKQFYHCFGCGASGDAIKFLRENEGLSFMDAIEKLASMANIELPKLSNKLSDDSKSLYTINTEAKNFFINCLKNNQNAKKYLVSRGISSEMIDLFEIGFAPESWDGLKKVFDEKNYVKEAIDLGLLINNKNKTYDRFRNRIMFPIKNSAGKVIAFGGRTIDSNEKAKYINSPESNLFHKSYELYGLHESSKYISKKNRVILVEGYTDVISLHKNGFDNVVASLGTAFTKHHIKKLKRYSKKITFCFDGDIAGKAAAWKALENILEEYTDDITVDFCFLDEGKDPDQLARDNPERFTETLSSSIKLSEFMIGKIREELNLENLEDATQFINTITPLIKKIPNGIFKKLISDKIEKIVDLDKKYFLKSNVKNQKLQIIDKNIDNEISSKDDLILTLLLNFPDTIDNIHDKIKDAISSKLVVDMLDLAKSFKTTSGYNLNRFLETEEKMKNLYLTTIEKKTIESNRDDALKTLEDIITQHDFLKTEREYYKILDKYTRGESLTKTEEDILRNYKK